MSDVQDFIEINGKPYSVVKTGRAQAEQVVQVTRWISRHGVKAIQSVQSDSLSLEGASGIEFLGKFVEALTPDALIDLFVVLVGCPKEDAEVYFDIAVLVDVALQVHERQPAVRRLVERFFSTPNSASDMVASSTTSEPPTDGPTSKS
jgi:hypothetical protein